MKIIIFYIFLILIFIPILFKIVFITRTIEEGFKDGNKKDKKNKEVSYKLVGDKKGYSFLYGKNTIEIFPSNKTKNITDIYFDYKSFPDTTLANISSFDDISNSEFMIKTPNNKYKISFSSSKKPIIIIVNETEYMIELEKKEKEGKFDILWYQKVSGTIDGFDIKLTEKKLDDVEIVMVLYTAILIVQKMKDLDNVDYNKMFK
jgi:hypothetical protein